ncbi:MAG: glycosyltransferase family 2 protein [Candidatus Aenigmarchaeota archaeon]|nr:glycosyltransferase family 2 protein [Candidatus Aenigmarchaeota archaeon]
MSKTKLTILMPVRNEGEVLQKTLNVMKAIVDVPHEVLVVHDDEVDDSIPVVKALKGYPQVRCVHNKLGRGVANAVKAGVESAKGEYVFITVADDFGPLFSIGKMISHMDKGHDFVSGTRYSDGGRVHGGSFIGGMFSRVANKLFYHLAGSKLTDSTVGFKMFRRSVFGRIELDARPVGWLVGFEMSIKAQLVGLRMGEIPIISINRMYGGASTFKFRAWTWEYFKWFLHGIKILRGK